jgi:S-(hydroxymethyl)glutathione dehydrogenase / alcohol dehydrogenase
VKALTAGRGADFTLEAAGRPEAMEQALLATHSTGVVVLTGVETLTAEVTLPALALAIRGRDVRSCQNGRVRMRRDVARFVAMLEDGSISAERIIGRRYALDEINDAYDASHARSEPTGVIVP